MTNIYIESKHMYISKKYLSITLLSLVSCVPVLSMHQEQNSNTHSQALELSSYNNQHVNIEHYLATHFPTAETLEQLTTALIEQSRTDTTLEQLLQSSEFTHNLITYLSNKFDKYYLECALLLNTPESITCYNKQLKQLLTITKLDEVLELCIITGSTNAFRRLLPLVSAEHYNYLLFQAVLSKNAQAITLIMNQAGTALLQPNSQFLIAAQNNFIEAIKTHHNNQAQAFLECGLSPNFVNTHPYHTTPLQCAILHNNLDLAHLLIQHGADVNQASDRYPVPLVLALRQDINLPLAFIELLVRSGANTLNINKALAQAVARNRPDIVQLLMRQPNINVNYSDALTDSPLIIAVRENRQAIAQLLLKHPQINIEQRDHGWGTRNALEYALRGNNRALAHALLNKGANPRNIQIWIATSQEHALLTEIRNERVSMNQTAEQGNIKAIHELRSQNIPLTPRAIQVLQALYTKFFDALTTGNIEWVKWAIKCGLSVNIHGPDGNTPLHIAIIRSSHLALSNFNGNTALYQAAEQKNQELIKLLLLVGADPTLTNNNGQTPVHLATDKPHLLNLFMSFAHRNIPYSANPATPEYTNPEIQWPAPANVPHLLEPQASHANNKCTIS